MVQTNVLHYGDNLGILGRYIPDASVDLIYLDPPFNSNRDRSGKLRECRHRRCNGLLVRHWCVQ